jgi:glycosyltransferase involved in cell wall biosynthesis
VRILTWHVHGNYLYYLSRIEHEVYLPVGLDMPGYGGRGSTFPFGSNVQGVAVEDLERREFDCVLYQSEANFDDARSILTLDQRRLPAIVLEHDPPRKHPTDNRHWAADEDVTLVHVTHFNALMWDNGNRPVRVIEHGVDIDPAVRYTGEIERGLVAVNNLPSRGRRLGLDVFEALRNEVPLDLVGMGSEAAGGLGEVPPMEFPAFAARYRFFFNPIRYTSFGLAVCEAMTLGMPVVGLATTEMARLIRNGVDGYTDTDPRALLDPMRRLLADPALARRLGDNARERAHRRFGIGRFTADWDAVLRETAAPRTGPLVEARP